MAVEGFAILGSVSTTISSGANAFPADITFATDTPSTVAREIQIQIYAGSSSIIFVRRNGVNFPINNSVAIDGSVTFTLLVLSTDTLNIRTGGASIDLDIIVAG